MRWYEYSCCGQTFTRWKRYSATPTPCPRCARQVLPFASCQIKEAGKDPSPE